MRVTASAHLRVTAINKAVLSRMYSEAVKVNKLSKASLDDEKTIMGLIFGKKTYPEFSVREKTLVDRYQDKVYQESCGCVVLPNTYMALQERVCELFLVDGKQ